jgi:asparaginyl-tRNA synthetase
MTVQAQPVSVSAEAGISGTASASADTRAHLTSATTALALSVQDRMLRAARSHLTGLGFTELLPPILGPVTDPGVRGAKQVDIDYYGHRYKLMTSAILYKQASLLTFERIFYVAPNIRLEPLETANTGRHLTEFHQLDVEAAGASRAEAMELAEKLVAHMITAVCANLGDRIAAAGRDTAELLRSATTPFDRTSHAEACARLRAIGHSQSPDAELDWAGEAKLSRQHDRPLFITDYPKGSRGFYDREREDQPGILENFDLLLPGGFGELISGSRRENRYREIVTRIRETGENPAKYGWYLGVLRDGLPASSGFGIGVERLTRFLAGLDSVAQATSFPKRAGVLAP